MLYSGGNLDWYKYVNLEKKVPVEMCIKQLNVKAKRFIH